MNMLSPVSTADMGGGTPSHFGPAIGCNQAEFPALLRRYRLGLALFVAAVAMLFVGFSSAYVVRRDIPTYDAGTGAYSTAWEPLRLPVTLLLINTCLLIGASGALEAVRRRARVRRNPRHGCKYHSSSPIPQTTGPPGVDGYRPARSRSGHPI